MQTIGQRSILIAFALTAVMAAAVVGLLSLLGPDWGAYAPATCTSTRCFCEAARRALIVQPADSWSSYGYVFVGFLMIVLSRSRNWSSAFPPAAAAMFGITAIAVGVGSVLLHATLTLWGQFLDVLGMYLVGSFMFTRALSRWRNIPDRQAMIFYVVMCAALITVLALAPEVRRWLFAVVLISAIGVELLFARHFRPGAKLRFYLFGILAKAIAFTIWNLDQHLIVCAQHSLLQGHAVWHLLGATSLWLTFLYYRSERAA